MSDHSNVKKGNVAAPSRNGSLSKETNILDLESVNTEFDFAACSEDLEDELLQASLAEYQLYLDQLDRARAHLDSLLASTAATLELLSEITTSFKVVEVQTTAFEKQTERVLGDQDRSEKIAHEVKENLQYYEPLQRITRRLNAPGAGTFVRGKEFSEMLVTLDQCIDYMHTHPKQKEADTYRSRYKQLLTRALTLVRTQFINAVRETAAEVAKRVADRQFNDTTMSALLYAKFRVGAAEMKELGLEIQKRANPPADAEPGVEGEYQSLMTELHTSFAASRGRLLIPLVRKKLAEIAQTPSSSNLVTFARASISYVRGICLDEFELWAEWFHGQRGLYDFLESVVEPLHDFLRPRIIHENQFVKLCQLVELLQTRYMNNIDDEDDMLDPTQLDFGILIQGALEDAQTRIVFRAQAILRDEIENFRPQVEDLEALKRSSRPMNPRHAPVSGRRGTTHGLTTPLPKDPEIIDEDVDSGDESQASWAINSSETALQSCYPTLRRAIKLLSRIYRLVNSSVFDDLAHQIVHQTTLSIHAAATQFSSKYSAADGQLFLLRHLLLLKSQIVAFDIEFVTPDISFDFPGVTSTFYELRERGGLFNPLNYLRLLRGGLFPRVVENMLDAKVELDGRLRAVINDLTTGYASLLTNALPTDIALISNRADDLGGKSVATTRKVIEKELPLMRQKMDEYLDDPRTKETLVAAVQDLVQQRYENFFDSYNSSKTGRVTGSRIISTKGKSREDDVWDIDTFAEWTEGIFQVGREGLIAMEDEVGRDESNSRSISRSGST